MGAWPRYVELGSTAQTGSPHAYRIIAVKRELAYNGLARGVDLSTPRIGHPAARAITAFQTQAGVTVDGVVGPDTGRALFKPRIGSLETSCAIPQHFACRIVAQESNFDPAAVNEESGDFGIVQIHAASHPTITLAEAFDPGFALGDLTSSLQATFLKLGDWDCAVAAWHVGGGGAQVWCESGKAATGGTTWWPDLFAEATGYVALVKGRRC